jgi:hypothetical protein
MFWECNTCSARESTIDERDVILGSGLWSEGADFKRLLHQKDDKLLPPQISLAAWYRVLMNYTRRSLTRSSDKLAAISGIASVISQASGFAYRHGLWEEDIKKGLLWATRRFGNTPAATDEISTRLPGPSWSWCTTNRSVIYDISLTVENTHLKSHPNDVQLIREPTATKHKSFFGENSHILTLEAFVKPVQAISSRQHHAFIRDPGSDETLAVATLDEGISTRDLNDVFALWVLEIKELGAAQIAHLFFLLIVRNTAHEGTWKRIGVGKQTIRNSSTNYGVDFGIWKLNRLDIS